MANLMTDPTRTYATYANAEAALRRAVERRDMSLADLRYVITATPEGRFAPAVLWHQPTLKEYEILGFAHRGIPVIG